MIIADVLAGLAARVERIGGVTVTTDPNATVVVPMAVVTDESIDYHATMGRGSDDVNVAVTLYVSRSDSPEGSFEVRAYLSGHGDRSIRAAIETSCGPHDPLNAAMVRAVSGTHDDAAEVPTGESFITATVTALVTVSGTE